MLTYAFQLNRHSAVLEVSGFWDRLTTTLQNPQQNQAFGATRISYNPVVPAIAPFNTRRYLIPIPSLSTTRQIFKNPKISPNSGWDRSRVSDPKTALSSLTSRSGSPSGGSFAWHDPQSLSHLLYARRHSSILVLSKAGSEATAIKKAPGWHLASPFVAGNLSASRQKSDCAFSMPPPHFQILSHGTQTGSKV